MKRVEIKRKHVEPRLIFAPVPSQESFALISLDMSLNLIFFYILRSLLWRQLSLHQYIFLLRDQLKHASVYGIFSLNWRPIGDLRLFCDHWSGSSIFDTFPIPIFNFYLNHQLLRQLSKTSNLISCFSLKPLFIALIITFDKRMNNITEQF